MSAAFEELMRLSAEAHAQGVAYFGAMTEAEFLDHLVGVLNDRDMRQSMIVAVVREAVIDRLDALACRR